VILGRWLREGEEQLGAVLDDAAEFLLRAGEEARTSSKVMSGMLKASQKRTKRAPFYGGVDVEYAGEKGGLIGDDADRRPSNRAKPTTRFLAKCSWTSKKVRIVHDGVDASLRS